MPLKIHFEEQPTLNLTSMIDVVFLLIIFFMAGTKFTEMERNIKLDVPRVSKTGALSAAPKQRVINVYRNGAISIDRTQVSLEELQEKLTASRAAYNNVGVIVRGDGEGAFQNVASVLNACRQAGIEDMGISVRIARKEDQP